MEVKVKALINFKDLDEGKSRLIGNEWICNKERADFLVEHNAVEIIEEIEKDVFEEFEKEVEKETVETVIEEKKKEKPKKKKSSKK